MREKLIQYVDLLFAGTQSSEDMKQEILQNTLDHYDDLIAEGKVPEAAYQLAIGGIGDISEILAAAAAPADFSTVVADSPDINKPDKKWLRAVAVGLYILSPVPLLALNEAGLDTIGLCGTLAIVALATMLIILTGKKHTGVPVPEKEEKKAEKSPLQKSIDSLIWAVGLATYLLVSFLTGSWHITWIIFPLIGAVQGLTQAIWDFRKAVSHEG